MPSQFLTVLKRDLEGYLQDFSLTTYQRKVPTGRNKTLPSVGSVAVYIGDLPPKKSGDTVAEQPFVVLTLLGGEGVYGEFFEEVAFLLGTYCEEEEGDAESAELELALLRSKVAGFVRQYLGLALDGRYTCLQEKDGRYIHWQKRGFLPQTRPFMQEVLLTRWGMPGWE